VRRTRVSHNCKLQKEEMKNNISSSIIDDINMKFLRDGETIRSNKRCEFQFLNAFTMVRVDRFTEAVLNTRGFLLRATYPAL
jgi:hypothetical protein